jgi:hypothetical protein
VLRPFACRSRRGGVHRAALVAALLALLPLLAACSDEEDEDPTPPPATAASSTSEAAIPTPGTPTVAQPIASPDAGATPPALPPPVDGATPVGSPELVPTPTPIVAVELTPGPDVTAEEILRFGAGRMANIRSAHFKATIDGTVYIDDARSLQLVSAEGNVVRPDRVQAQFRLRIGDQAISTIRMVTIGEDAWMTDIISGDWVAAVAEFNYDVSAIFDPAEGLAAVMLGVDDPVRLPDEELDGRDVYVIEATGDKELIGPVTSYTLLGYPATVRAWIDQETGDLLKIVLTEPPSPENDDPSTWTLELSNYDADITIEPPETE